MSRIINSEGCLFYLEKHYMFSYDLYFSSWIDIINDMLSYTFKSK